MAYERPRNKSRLLKNQKDDLLKQYFEDYRALYEKDSSALNLKIPRGVFDDLLNELGEILLGESKRLANIEGAVGTFLDNNPLPKAIDQYLSRDFRVFCLALNAMKQWVAAEQSATDRYLLGGDARKLCRKVADRCLVSGETLGFDCELHHPVRDGRPPVPLSKHEHARIEGQVSSESDDPIEQKLSGLRREGNRSSAQLRRGCLDLIGKSEGLPSKPGAANDRAFAKKAAVVTKIGYEEILVWLKEKKGL
jgi:hypothetical protein